jgi:hypothetical protein
MVDVQTSADLGRFLNKLAPPPNSYFRIILVTLALIVIAVVITTVTNLKEVSDNWPKYRCRPQYMVLANLFGQNVNENFNFCLNEVFKGEASGVLGPIYKNLAGVVGFLSTILNVTNSLRLQMATLVGGISNVFQDFASRLNQFFFAIRMSAQRIRSLMYRVYGTLFAFIFMGLSGVASVQSFSDTIIGRFLNTMCFHPSTLIVTRRGPLRIDEVKIGDVLSNGSRVTALFRFHADGQPMVHLHGVHVSTNHYVLYNGHWIQSGEHPDAVAAGDYTGGLVEPLVCLNTDDHRIPIADLIFNDYDETEAADPATEAAIEAQVNGGIASKGKRAWSQYGAVFHPDLRIKTQRRGLVRAADLELGDELPGGSRICGIVQKEMIETTELGISPSTLLFTGGRWQRIGRLVKVQPLSVPEQHIGLFVTPNSIITTGSGLSVRDYMEILSPDTEAEYSAALAKEVIVTSK